MRAGPDTQYHRYHNMKSWRRHRRRKGFTVTKSDLLDKINERYAELPEAERQELYEQLTRTAREALHEVIAAWDSTDPAKIEPAIEQARAIISENK